MLKQDQLKFDLREGMRKSKIDQLQVQKLELLSFSTQIEWLKQAESSADNLW